MNDGVMYDDTMMMVATMMVIRRGQCAERHAGEGHGHEGLEAKVSDSHVDSFGVVER
jgi:hypothetical protein